MIYTENYNNDWTNEYNDWTNKCNDWTNKYNEWDHWIEDLENVEVTNQYIMIDAKIICVNNILDQKHLIKFQENKQMTTEKENMKERIWTNIEIEQINKRKRYQAKRDFEIDEWTRTQVYNDCYFIDIERGGEEIGSGSGSKSEKEEEYDIECIKKKEVFEYFNEIIQTTYLFITAIRYL